MEWLVREKLFVAYWARGLEAAEKTILDTLMNNDTHRHIHNFVEA